MLTSLFEVAVMSRKSLIIVCLHALSLLSDHTVNQLLPVHTPHGCKRHSRLSFRSVRFITTRQIGDSRGEAQPLFYVNPDPT